jgi:hypothetical protein
MYFYKQLFRLGPVQRCQRRRLIAPLTNALLPETLAFWALWHCRHARPPDALRAAI